jgi:hypothetical protein
LILIKMKLVIIFQYQFIHLLVQDLVVENIVFAQQ